GNGRVVLITAAGASVPNASSRFKTFAAGKMLSSSDADEAVIDDVLAETCGYAKPADAVGQTIEFLTTTRADESKEGKAKTGNDGNKDEGLSFFGLPLEENDSVPANALSGRTLRVAGVLAREKREGAAQGGPVGLF